MESSGNLKSALLALSLLVSACGGGGGSSGGGATGTAPPAPPPVVQSDFAQGIFRSDSTFEDLCEAPRPGTADLQGTTEDENDWLRAWSNDTYLWYDEIIDEDPALFTTPEYFDLMRTFETTASGAPRDQFHFSLDTEFWLQLSQSGTSAGYGANITLLSATPPRRAVIVAVQPGSPADVAGIGRGTVITSVDGIDLINGTDADTLNAGLFPSSAGETHEFEVENFDGSDSRTVTLTSAEVTIDTVPLAQIIDVGADQVGYMVFDAFLAPSEERLFDEIERFAAAGITELVLDLRYNGGGFLDIANELAFMIAGPDAQGQVFEEIRFNDKHPTINPVTGETLAPDTFLTTAQGFSVPRGTPLPTLNIERVFILSGPDTSSASESVINGLLGIGFPVVLIGETTSGKPFGFFPTDNCGTTYFSIQFQGINAQGFGDFSDGFIPAQSPVVGFEVEGCEVADDLARQLGDPLEFRLATALGYITTGDCSAAPIVTTQAFVKQVNVGSSEGALTKPVLIPGGISQP